MVLANEGRTLVVGYLADQLSNDLNGNGKPDGVDLFENAIKRLGLSEFASFRVGFAHLEYGSQPPHADAYAYTYANTHAYANTYAR